jgi:hypothetical protein
MTILFGEERHSIIVQTKKGTDIDNEQLKEISSFELKQLRNFDDYRKYCYFRGDVSPLYNCHGMTFANRRTGIFEFDAIEQILKDDDYEEIASKDTLPGDIAIYWENNDVQHSGIVVGTTGPFVGSSEPLILHTPWICSKWGKGPEVVHAYNNCPYNVQDIKYYRMGSWKSKTD